MATVDRLRNFLGSRQTAYKQTFTGPHAETVLADLAAFCRANQSTFHPDARVSAALDGRREVILRILDHINLSPDELFEISTGQRRHQAALDKRQGDDNDD